MDGFDPLNPFTVDGTDFTAACNPELDDPCLANRTEITGTSIVGVASGLVFLFGGASGSTIQGMSVNSFPGIPGVGGNGIITFTGGNHTIRHNDASGNANSGILSASSPGGVLITENTTTGNDSGIVISSDTGTIIGENQANSNRGPVGCISNCGGSGILNLESTGTIISGKTANMNRFGIIDFFSIGSVITDKVSNSNGAAGGVAFVGGILLVSGSSGF